MPLHFQILIAVYKTRKSYKLCFQVRIFIKPEQLTYFTVMQPLLRYNFFFKYTDILQYITYIHSKVRKSIHSYHYGNYKISVYLCFPFLYMSKLPPFYYLLLYINHVKSRAILAFRKKKKKKVQKATNICDNFHGIWNVGQEAYFLSSASLAMAFLVYSKSILDSLWTLTLFSATSVFLSTKSALATTKLYKY